MKRDERYKGYLMGIAVGDALGAPLEFWRGEKVIGLANGLEDKRP